MRSAIWSSASTPKPTGIARFVAVSNSARAGSGRAREPEPGGAPVVGHRPGPALQRAAGHRDGENVEPVAHGEGAQERAEHPAAAAIRMTQIDQPVALPEGCQ